MEASSVFIIATAVLGLAVGSYLGGVSFRLGSGMPQGGRSRCPWCGHELAAFDLVPVLSYLALRGRCRYCRQTISLWYPAIELATAALFVIVALQLPITNYQLPITNYLVFARNLFAVSILLLIAVTDLRYGIVPDAVTLPAIVIVALTNALPITNLLFGALAGGGFFLAQYLLSRGRAVGDGDIRIGVLLGVLLGWGGTLFALLISYIAGALVAVVLLAIGKTTMQSRIPMGPFLAVGGILTLLWGDQLLQFLNFSIY